MSRERALVALAALLVLAGLALQGLPEREAGDGAPPRLSPAAPVGVDRASTLEARGTERAGTEVAPAVRASHEGRAVPASAPPSSPADVVLVSARPTLTGSAREVPYERAAALTQAAVDVASLDLELARALRDGDLARVELVRQAREEAARERDRLQGSAPSLGDAGA